MNRRQLLATLGTAAGISTIFSTSAFTSVSADRSVSIRVASDADALLTLRPADGSNGEYAALNNGQLELQLNSKNSDVSGNGVPVDALTQILDVFVIENQGTQEVGVRLDRDKLTGEALTFVIPTSEVKAKSNGDKPEVEFGAGYGITEVTLQEDGDVTVESIDIGPGESVAVGLRIDSRDSNPRDSDGEGSNLLSPGAEIDGSITVKAEVDGQFGADDNEVSQDSDDLEAKQ